jgi:putative aldouronate transport system permease protein
MVRPATEPAHTSSRLPSRTDVGSFFFDFVNHLLLILLACVTLYPFVYTLSASLSDPLLVMQNKITLLPREPTLGVYRLVFARLRLGVGFTNTIQYTVLGTAINLFMTSLTAYALSRKELPYRRFFTFLFTFTLFFSGGMIPTYLLVRALGMIDRIWAMVVPGAISTFLLIVMRTFFLQVPESLTESALMDGANHVTILARIILPLSQAVLATVGLFYAVGHWNSFFPALIYLNRSHLWPIQLMIRALVIEATALTEVTGQGVADFFSRENENVQDWMLLMSIKYAVIFVTALPIIFVYPFVQRYFIKGVMIGAIKE